jgi:TatA/E family protein of Tat protein translocase
MHIGAMEILVLIFVVVLFFGPGRIQKVFTEAGKGIHSFRKGLQGKEDKEENKELKVKSKK